MTFSLKYAIIIGSKHLISGCTSWGISMYRTISALAFVALGYIFCYYSTERPNYPLVQAAGIKMAEEKCLLEGGLRNIEVSPDEVRGQSTTVYVVTCINQVRTVFVL